MTRGRRTDVAGSDDLFDLQPPGPDDVLVCVDAELLEVAHFAALAGARWALQESRAVVPAPGLLNRREAAAYLKVSLSTFHRCVRPFLTAVRTGGPDRYRVEDLNRWAASRARGG